MSRYKGSCSLSSINEGDEHSSLQDILNARGTWLDQDELWAVCRECAVALKRVSDSSEMLQSLVVMLETLAFDSQGYVCFIDPEPDTDSMHYKPPEYDKIGNSCKGHVYSLGLLIYEASAYSSNTSKIPEHSGRLRKLLKDMMETVYEDRIDLDGIIAECDLYFKGRSSHNICKRLVCHMTGHIDTEESSQLDKSPESLKALLTTSQDMSMQDLVDKYTPARLKARTKKNAPKLRDENIGIPLEDIMPEPPAAFNENPAGASAFTATNSPSTGQTGSSNAELSPLSGVLRAGGTPPRIPVAYSSSATHFTPIVISNSDPNSKKSPSRSSILTKESKVNKNIKELKRNLLKQQSKTNKTEYNDDGPSTSNSVTVSPNQTGSTTLTTSPRQSTNSTELSPRNSVSGTPPTTQPLRLSAVRPQPRKAEPVVPHTQLNANISSTVPISNDVTPSNIQSTTTTNIQNSPTVGTAPITAAPTFIPSFPGIPFMVQQDPNTGAMQFVPMMTNMPSTSFTGNTNTQGAVNNSQNIPAPYFMGLPPQQPFMTTQPQQINTVPLSPASTRRERDRPRRYKQRSASSERVLDGIKSSSKDDTKRNKQRRSQSLGRDESPKLSVAKSNKPPVAPKRSSKSKKNKVEDSPSLSSDEATSDHSFTKKTKSILKDSSKSSRSRKDNENRAGAANSAPSPDSGIDPHGMTKYPGDMQISDAPSSPPSKKAITKLIRDEFAYEGYLDNGAEVVSMSSFITGLGSLKWDTFCSAVAEKYCDLFWSEELLMHLYEVVNGKPPEITQPASIPGALRTGSARVLSVDEPTSSAGVSAPSPFRPIGAQFSSTSSSSSLVKPRPMLAHIDEMDGMESNGDKVKSPNRPLALGRHHRSSSEQDLSYRAYDSGMSKSLSQTALDSSSLNPVSLMVNSLTLSNSSGGSRRVIHIQGKNGELSEDFMDTSRSVFEHESDSHSSATTAERRLRISRSHPGMNSTGSLGSSDPNSFSNSSNVMDPFNDSAFGSKLSSEYDMNMTDNSMQQSIPICSSVFFAATLDSRTESAHSFMQGKSENRSVDGLEKKMADLDQQIRLNCSRRNKAVKYIQKMMDSSMSGSVKGNQPDYKPMIQKIRGDHSEALKHLEYLTKAKSQLAVLQSERWSLELSQLYSFTKVSTPLIVVDTAENPTLQYHVTKNHRNSSDGPVLHAGKPIGLMSYLFARGALTQGYLLDFFHTYRYFTKSNDLFAFLADKYSSALEMENESIKEKVNKRCVELFMLWVDVYYTVDFKFNPSLEQSFLNFIQEEVCRTNPEEGEQLLTLIDNHASGTKQDLIFIDSFGSAGDLLDDEPVPLTKKVSRSLSRTASLLRKTELEEICEESRWNPNKSILTIGSGKNAVHYRKGRTGLTSCLGLRGSKLKSPSEENPPYHLSVPRNVDAFNLTDHTPQKIAEQLTLIEQTLFSKCHPVHFMNSLAQGIGANLAAVNQTSNKDTELHTGIGSKPLFVGPYAQDNFVQTIIENAQRVSYWVTAELISCNSAKGQIGLLSKFLQIAKICKEIRNFSTCVAIKDGLENILIRHLPAWKEVPARLTQELDSIKLLLKSDSMGLMPEDGLNELPTIPSTLLFIIHVQQMEQGGFTLANGMYKWNKLRSLAKLVDQIRLFKRYKYDFPEDSEMKNTLEERVKEMCSQDLHALALNSSSQQSTGSRWSGVLKKVKNKLGNNN